MENKERRVRFNLFPQIKKLETARGRNFTATHIADEAGLHYNTVLDVLYNRTRQIRFDTLEKLLAFLRAEGMDVSLDDLIIEAEVETDSDASPR